MVHKVIKLRKRRNRINWKKIKVTFVWADKNNLNPLNPNSNLTDEQREKKIIAIAARIWRGETERT